MNQTQIESLIEAGKSRKADFVEIYEEESRNSSIALRDQKIEQSLAATDYGIGIRLVYGTDVLYAYTSNDDKDHLLSLIHLLADSRGEAKNAPGGFKLAGQPAKANFGKNIHDPRKVPPFRRLEILQTADDIARKVSSKIVQVGVSASDIVTNVLIANSEGLWVEDLRIRSRFFLSVTAEKDGERFVASESPGAVRGFEFFEGLPVENLARRAGERAMFMLDAGYIEGKKMPVVMGNGFGGVIFHEACGHPLETEAIRKKSSPFVGKLGEAIAQSCLTAYDDGTIEEQYGSLTVDDEGMPTQKTLLIEKGILKGYLADRIGAQETGVPRTGSGRRESYQYAPVSRMRNTYIAAGSDRLDDMVSSVDFGLYAKRMGGGSVNPATGEFNFAVEEGYVIRNGKIAEPVRGATLIGKGHEILPRISMVGEDLELAAGTCGASSGSIPVTVGQPSLKVDEILVGGR
ncbi:TldD/PmbA family protein [Leptospira wolffii]|uniref:TldD/PmbA family protein n=1 Tax=Leptospira wolffii TaxID=409998 RepID=UPI00034CE134|nr:TldD/PmbA family protein [Leptospira wolffii]TGK56791.1 TldD/PmbA family protein [Leptospira wolffii]TGK71627.1 TldD/PmbA family protein [Leptospira wolffii]TGK75516.1 TldD/PmbA family protein [Leptospira wolffii]TGL32994.1 TldD/PmbA family protein [Leptospira wolffii]